MGNVPQDWEDRGRVPPQGGPSAGEDAAEEGHHGQVGLPTAGRGNDGSGAGGGGDVRPPPPEYRRPVYRHSTDTGAMSGGGVTAGSAGDNEMVGSGRHQLRVGEDKDRDGGGGENGGQRGEGGV